MVGNVLLWIVGRRSNGRPMLAVFQESSLALHAKCVRRRDAVVGGTSAHGTSRRGVVSSSIAKALALLLLLLLLNYEWTTSPSSRRDSGDSKWRASVWIVHVCFKLMTPMMKGERRARALLGGERSSRARKDRDGIAIARNMARSVRPSMDERSSNNLRCGGEHAGGCWMAGGA